MNNYFITYIKLSEKVSKQMLSYFMLSIFSAP